MFGSVVNQSLVDRWFANAPVSRMNDPSGSGAVLHDNHRLISRVCITSLPVVTPLSSANAGSSVASCSPGSDVHRTRSQYFGAYLDAMQFAVKLLEQNVTSGRYKRSYRNFSVKFRKITLDIDVSICLGKLLSELSFYKDPVSEGDCLNFLRSTRINRLLIIFSDNACKDCIYGSIFSIVESKLSRDEYVDAALLRQFTKLLPYARRQLLKAQLNHLRELESHPWMAELRSRAEQTR